MPTAKSISKSNGMDTAADTLTADLERPPLRLIGRILLPFAKPMTRGSRLEPEGIMRSVVGLIVALGVVVSVSASVQKPGEQTWKGKISDSNCNEKHPAGEHEGKKMTDADCTGICVKKGAKYVFVSDGKVYQLANQTSKQIASHAGQNVELTGVMKGDTITASNMKVAAAAKK
jgi:hypothetical protein